MDYKVIVPKNYILFASTSIAILSVLGLYFYQRTKKFKPPAKWQEIGKVTELFIYPLKSGRRVPVKKAECTKFGFKQTEIDEKTYQMRDR